VFITAAVVKGGKDDGKILGCIVWGQKMDASGDWMELLPPEFFDSPPPEFFSAATAWNGTAGKISLPDFKVTNGSVGN
jgi:hypothetical protein